MTRYASLSIWEAAFANLPQNPWKEWFAAIELRKTILQDVERTLVYLSNPSVLKLMFIHDIRFPDILYFRDPDIQVQLTNILYLYSVMHPDIGYRQGMHELLAPLYHAVDYDSQDEDSSTSADTGFLEFCLRVWSSADAWVLFCAVMNGVGRWYYPRDLIIRS
jgi:TBC1 domain family member 5